MKIILIIIAIMLLFGSVYGQRNLVSLGSGDLPYSCLDNDSIVFTNSAISTAGNGVDIGTRSNVFINLSGVTLTCGTGGENNNYCIAIGGISANGIIYGASATGKLICGTGSSDYANCLRFSVSNGLLVDSVDMDVYGSNSYCIETPSPSGWNLHIRGGTHASYATAYTSRCQWDGACDRLRNAMADHQLEAGFLYTYKIEDLTISTSPGQGLAIAGRDQGNASAIIDIQRLHITCDHINTNYSYPSSTCYSSANPYGLHTKSIGPGSYIADITIRSGEVYGGGRGMMFENPKGTAINPIIVERCDVIISEGPNAEYGEGGVAVHCLRIRYDGGTMGHMIIRDCDFEAYLDSNTGTDYRNRDAALMRYSDLPGTEGIVIENCTFRCLAPNADCSSEIAVFDAVESTAGIIFRNNRLEGNGNIIQIGHTNSGAINIKIESDTLRRLSPSYAPHTYHIGYLSNNWTCTGTVSKNVVYENGAGDDVSWANAGTLDLALIRTVKLYVQGNNDLPVVNAAITLRDNADVLIASGNTNANGLFRIDEVTYWSGTRTTTDNNNDHKFYASYSGDNSSNLTFTINMTDAGGTDTLTLSSTVGTGEWEGASPGGKSNRSKRGMFNKIIGDYDEENSNYHDSCVTGYPSRCSYSVR